jgi:hypothetical protein
MKKILLIVATVFLMSTNVILAQVVVVDGDRDAFYDSLTGPDDGYLQLRSYCWNDNGKPSSDADLSAKMWAAWDSTWFYFYTEVKDDIIAGDGQNSYQSDGLEFKFDPQATSTANSIVAPNLTILDTSDAGVIGWDDLNSIPDSMKMYAKRITSDGYALEVALKWDAIVYTSATDTERVSVAVDSVFGLALNIHDNDDALTPPSREASVMWAARMVDAVWNNTSYLGTVKFLAGNKVQFIAKNNITGETNPVPFDGRDYFAIDGQKDPFYSSLTGPDDGYLQLKYYASNDNGAPYDNADLSAKAWAAWDSTWFYFYTEVMDDIIAGDGGASYQSDGIEFKFDPQATSAGNTIFAPNLTILDTSDGPEVTGWDDLNNVPDSMKMYAKRMMTGGYALEVALKWDAIVSGTETVSVAVDSVFGLAFNVHDNDTAHTREGSVMWAAVMLDAVWNTNAYLGTVKFLPDHKLQFIPTNNIDSTNTNPVPFDGTPFFINVDGQKDPVYNALLGPDDGYLQIRSFAFVPENGPQPSSDADLSARTWSFWDDTWFYWYTEVRDNIIAGDGGASYQSDGIEWKIDPQATSSGNTIFAPNLTILDTSDGPEVTGWDDLNSVPDSMKMYAKRMMTGGYALEVALKWDAIVSGTETVQVAVDSVFGLAFNVHDNDTAHTREKSVQWAARLTDFVWNNNDYLGTIKFMPDNKLQFIPTNNITGETNEIPYDGSEPVGVEEENSIPLVFSLKQNYPNPFNPTTTISYTIPLGSQVHLKVYDILGREVVELVNKEQNPGEYKVKFDASNYASGVYFYRIEAGSYIKTLKMMLIK